MDEREKRDVREWSQTSDTRRRRPENNARKPVNRSGQSRQRMSEAGPGRNRRPARQSSRARRRRRNAVIRWFLFFVLIIIAIGGFVIWKRYGSTNEKADLKQYYGVESETDPALVIDDQVVKRFQNAEEGNTPDPVKVYDGQYYVEYSVAHNRINKRFYWDSNENVLLYTLPGGSVSAAVGSKEYTDITEKKSEDYVILKTEGKIAYIALPFIQQYTNMEYEVYDDPTRVVITTEWGEKKVASIKRDTQVRYQGGVKSPVLTEVKKSDKVTVLEDENDWMKVATKDGFIGYVKTNALNSVEKELVSRDYEEPEYTNISENYTINMAWHNVSNADANSYILETIASTKGLNTIAPTWFSLADTEGNITSLADADYVNYASGQLLIDGKAPGPDTRRLVSYLPERTYLSDWMTVVQLLDFFCDFYPDFDREAAEHMLTALEISPTQRIKQMSKGTREKVQLILVMSRRTRLYLLDEPIGGVDPATRDYIIHTILTNFHPDSTLLISTHLIADVERILDDVVFISRGQLVLHQSVDQIRQERGCSVDDLFREVFRYAE